MGAAIHLAPNATRVLKAWGCDLKSMDPSPCDYLSVWKPNGDFLATPAVTKDLQARLGTSDEWLLVHRVDLHNSLREMAEKGFEGRKPKLHLSCSIERVVRTLYCMLIMSDLLIQQPGCRDRQSQTGERKRSSGRSSDRCGRCTCRSNIICCSLPV